jgi:hypothetical protein
MKLSFRFSKIGINLSLLADILLPVAQVVCICPRFLPFGILLWQIRAYYKTIIW